MQHDATWQKGEVLVDEADDLLWLAHRLRANAGVCREAAKLCPEAAAKMLVVARQADMMVAEIDALCRQAKVKPMFRADSGKFSRR